MRRSVANERAVHAEPDVEDGGVRVDDAARGRGVGV